MIADFGRPFRKQVAALTAVITVMATVPASASRLVVRNGARSAGAPSAVITQKKVPLPTPPELEGYRKKLRSQWQPTQRDADRVTYLLLLLDYATVSLNASSSPGERQYRLTQLRNFVAIVKAERHAVRPPRGEWSDGQGNLEGMGRPFGPHAEPPCYHEGQEAECATDEEIAETQALADSVAYQNDANQQTYDEVMLMISGPNVSTESTEVASGPSLPVVCENCFAEAATATATMGASVAAVLGWEGAKADALAAGTKLSKATRWSWHLTLITTSLTAGYYLGSLVDCSRSARDPVTDSAPATEQAALPDVRHQREGEKWLR